MEKRSERSNPKVTEILDLLVRGVFLSSLFLAPGAATGIGAIFSFYEKFRDLQEYNDWNKFKIHRLRANLKRLKEQEFIEIVKHKDYSEIKLTEKGKLRSLNYKLRELKLKKQDKWDGKWRIVMYDIGTIKKIKQNYFRRAIKNLDLYPLQKSVYITPYPCNYEISLIRNQFDLYDEVIYITADYLENEKQLTKFFKI
jgi:hypothetical protein